VLEELNQFAYDLMWTWQPRIEGFFQTLDPELWKSTRQNPVLVLLQLGQEGLERACERKEVREALDDARSPSRTSRSSSGFPNACRSIRAAWASWRATT
jgi:glucan phosphorylase